MLLKGRMRKIAYNGILRERFNPDGSLLRKHQLRMLEMLRYIDRVCRNYGIKYWLCSGTLLGAVRHGGFIPWDDDLDIEMLREDYEKFVKVLQEEKNLDYILQTHQTDSNYWAPYGKLRDLHSYIKEDNSNDMYYKYHGVYVDIFIMEPSSSLFLTRCSTFLQYKVLYDMNLRIHHKLCRQVYFPVGYFLLYKFFFPLMRLISRCRAKDQLRHTLGSCFVKPRDRKDIFPLEQMEFEGYLFPVPGNYDRYLQKIYGDYMRMPDPETIRVHTTHVSLNK